VIADGDYRPYRTDIDWLYGYQRSLGTAALLALNNFADHAITVPIPPAFQAGQVLLANFQPQPLAATVTLPAYGTVAIYQDHNEGGTRNE
jgi:trehalose-6-phosphate hydrolase